ncbi:MAG TPA: hypothetical protein ENJ44_05850 [Oceanospirillales bacterium]|nr:hypothetical protein [Oceanospirillales bacterium]
MKAIIGGKIYNTETAELIVEGDNGLSVNDGYYRIERLYRTKKGVYFIHNASGQIVVLNSDFTFPNPELTNVADIKDWLELWKVAELPKRERKLFSITEG